METQASKSSQPLIWVAAIALIVFSGVGVAAFMGWLPTSLGKTDEPAVTKLDQPSAVAPRVAAAKPDREHERDERARERAGDERDHARLERERARAQAPAVTAQRCAECGVVQSVHEVSAKGEGTGLGAVGGAVVGGAVGSQVGGGDGKKIMAVVGAVGGAVAGNEIEKRVKATKSYEITIRFDDGSSRVISEANPPTWRVGDKVKVINGAIQSNA